MTELATGVGRTTDRPHAGDAGEATPRVVRPRRPAVGGRAVAGGLLVALAMVGVFVAWTGATAGPSTTYAVAAEDLAVGTVLEARHLRMVEVDLPTGVAQRAFVDAAPLLGAVVLAPVGAGELVQASVVARLDGGVDTTEVAFALDGDRALAGRLRRGQRVDVLATWGSGVDSFTVPVVKRALVVRAEAAGGSLGGGVGPDARVVVTLAVDRPGHARAVANAVATAEVTLVRAPVAPPGGPTADGPAASDPGADGTPGSEGDGSRTPEPDDVYSPARPG